MKRTCLGMIYLSALSLRKCKGTMYQSASFREVPRVGRSLIGARGASVPRTERGQRRYSFVQHVSSRIALERDEEWEGHVTEKFEIRIRESLRRCRSASVFSRLSGFRPTCTSHNE